MMMRFSCWWLEITLLKDVTILLKWNTSFEQSRWSIFQNRRPTMKQGRIHRLISNLAVVLIGSVVLFYNLGGLGQVLVDEGVNHANEQPKPCYHASRHSDGSTYPKPSI
jgi:hypothetical protein